MQNSELVITTLLDNTGDPCRSDRMRALTILTGEISTEAKYKLVLEIVDSTRVAPPELVYLRLVSDLIAATIIAFPEEAGIFINDILYCLEKRRNEAGFSPMVPTWGAVLGLLRQLPASCSESAVRAVGKIIFYNKFDAIPSGVAGWVSDSVAEFFNRDPEWWEIFKDAKYWHDSESSHASRGQEQILEELSYKAFGHLNPKERRRLIADFALQASESELVGEKAE